MEVKKMKTALEYNYRFSILVYNGKYPCYGEKERMVWEGLTLSQLTRWDWYFKYRAALLQIKYPKFLIETWSSKYDLSVDQKKQLLKNRITAKKGKITNYSRKLKLAENTWDFLFPIENDDLYKKAVIKINNLKNELAEMETEYKSQYE